LTLLLSRATMDDRARSRTESCPSCSS